MNERSKSQPTITNNNNNIRNIGDYISWLMEIHPPHVLDRLTVLAT